MGYYHPKSHGLSVIGEVWVTHRISRIPTWEMKNPMEYRRVWVIRGMVYERVDCTRNFQIESGVLIKRHYVKLSRIQERDRMAYLSWLTFTTL